MASCAAPAAHREGQHPLVAERTATLVLCASDGYVHMCNLVSRLQLAWLIRERQSHVNK